MAPTVPTPESCSWLIVYCFLFMSLTSKMRIWSKFLTQSPELTGLSFY
jgi:hypothetical protein